jgi:prepilin-type N-terminal cleavage/methylation domain-containing protein
MKINTSRKAGFTLVEIMIVVAIIGLLAAIAIPNFVKARTTSQMNACINNLRQIDGAKQQWALDNAVGGYLGRAGTVAGVVCPSGGSTATFAGSYTVGIVSTAPVCKIVTGTTPGVSHFLP